MITYVNTVLVSNIAPALLSAMPSAQASNTASANAGKFIIVNVDDNSIIDSEEEAASASRIKIGMVTKTNAIQIDPATKARKFVPVIKWSNIISADSVKALNESHYESSKYANESVSINFRSLSQNVLNSFDDGGKRIIVRLTFKDLPTRYRKWTESYEYVTKSGDTVNDIVKNIVTIINKDYKRARVNAYLGTASAGSNSGDPDTIAKTAAGSESGANAIILEAMDYDDDNSVDSLNWANTIRFNANVYWSDPDAEGWESTNKYFPIGVEITKTPGKVYVGAGKLVRDREAQAMGYLGILNRGEGTWPVIKPAMETNITTNYDVITLEFERMYRSADDLFRKTKETVEIYAPNATAGTSAFADVLDVLNAFVAGSVADTTEG